MHAPSVWNKDVAKQHARKWDRGLEETWGASPAAPLDGVDVAIYGWAADRCCENLEKALTFPELIINWHSAQAREKFDVPHRVNYCAPEKPGVDPR